MPRDRYSRVAYESFRSRPVGEGLPPYDELPEEEKEAWIQVSQDVIQALDDDGRLMKG